MTTLYFIGTLKLNLVTTLSPTGALNRLLCMKWNFNDYVVTNRGFKMSLYIYIYRYSKTTLYFKGAMKWNSKAEYIIHCHLQGL